MIDTNDTTPAEKDGKYEFRINYSGQEVSCRVEKEQQLLHVHIGNNLDAELKINNDGTISQTEGATLPGSVIDFIKKQVLGLHV